MKEEKQLRSRTAYAMQNFAWSMMGTLVKALLAFASQTVFIYTLGSVYLGVNGLFTNILGMLSLAELGIGGAISFSLYKPLAEHDTKKIRQIINFYRSAYRMVAASVTVVGVAIIPFLNVIIKDADGIEHIRLIYSIYLFNTVTSYLLTYKTTLLSADQRGYIITNINTVIQVATSVLQITVLLIYKNFIVYLLIGALVQFVGKAVQNYATGRYYSYIREKNNEQLPEEDKKIIYTKIKGMMVHKLGDVAINQTDSIITSAFVNITSVGLVSNFTLIINFVNSMISSFFSAAVAGLGNIVATETPEKRRAIYKKYDYLAFMFYGWSAICLYCLLAPFVTIWIGPQMLVDKATIVLLCVNYYFAGLRVPLGNIKSAAGIYEQDWWCPIVQSVINIVVSVVGAIIWGLKGVYVGTLVSSLVPNLVRPYMVYKYVFFTSSKEYYQNYVKRGCLIFLIAVGMEFLIQKLPVQNDIIRFIVIFVVAAIMPAAILVFATKNSEEFTYVKTMLQKAAVKIKSKVFAK